MPKAKVVRHPIYEDQLVEVPSDRTVHKIEELEDLLEEFPDFGSPVQSTYLIGRYGDGLRKLVVDGWFALYRHEDGLVRMLALVPGRAVYQRRGGSRRPEGRLSEYYLLHNCPVPDLRLLDSHM